MYKQFLNKIEFKRVQEQKLSKMAFSIILVDAKTLKLGLVVIFEM